MDYASLKQEIFDYFRINLRATTQTIQNSNLPQKTKSNQINQAVEAVRVQLIPILFNNHPELNVSKLYMLLQYCYTVMSLEYRNMVWPYEYMAFSRRNGELWERFCKAAWDNSQVPNLSRIEAPEFDDVRNSFRDRIIGYTDNNENQELIVNDMNSIFALVGEINMKQDEMFISNDINHIIDFKSGFSSNEKGNTFRVLAVGRAYKHWDPNVNLLFLVRQNENNNYLEIIRRSNLWAVHCGDEAYRKIDELTNAGIAEIRREAIDFQNDLSAGFWNYLDANDLTNYLDW